jgi:hypothetical protein
MPVSAGTIELGAGDGSGMTRGGGVLIVAIADGLVGTGESEEVALTTGVLAGANGSTGLTMAVLGVVLAVGG